MFLLGEKILVKEIMTTTIRATEAAREFSKVLSKVYYQGESFDIQRGKEIVAKIIPAAHSPQLRVQDLNALFQSLPSLEEEEEKAYKEDIEGIRNQMRT